MNGLDINDIVVEVEKEAPAPGMTVPTSLTQILPITNVNNENFDVFGVGQQGVWGTYWSPDQWSPWQSNFNGAAFTPTSLFAITNVAAANNLELFAIDDTGVLWHCWFNGSNGQWQSWVSNFNGATFKASQVFAVCNPMANNNLELFVVDSNSNLWHSWFNGADGQWQPWEPNFNGLTTSQASVFCIANNAAGGNLELFTIDTNGQVWHCWFHTQWEPWTLFSAFATPAVSIDGIANTLNNSLEMIVIDANGNFQHCSFTQGQWSTWQSGFNAASFAVTSICPVYVPGGPQYLYALDAGGMGHYCSFQSTYWSAWVSGLQAPQPQAFTSLVASNYSFGNGLQLFALDNNGNAWTSWILNTGWHAWVPFVP